MSEVTIRTNNVPRNLIYGYELTDSERKAFDYISEEELIMHDFFRYKGRVYDTQEFMRFDGIPEDSALSRWDGYYSESFFSGIVIRYTNNCEQVIVGTYFS